MSNPTDEIFDPTYSYVERRGREGNQKIQRKRILRKLPMSYVNAKIRLKSEFEYWLQIESSLIFLKYVFERCIRVTFYRHVILALMYTVTVTQFRNEIMKFVKRQNLLFVIDSNKLKMELKRYFWNKNGSCRPRQKMWKQQAIRVHQNKDCTYFGVTAHRHRVF